MLKDAGGIPAPGNQRREWDASVLGEQGGEPLRVVSRLDA
jgi:hypothetical protein